MKPRITVVNTGGTILSRFDAAKNGWVSSASIDDLAAQVPRTREIADLKVVDVAQVNAYRMDNETALSIARAVAEVAADPTVDGIVIVHGTASMEETAYLLQLTIDTDKPIAMTAAQRRFEDVGSDGPHNFFSAVKVAASPDAVGRGVCVVFDGAIHGARDVCKVHNQSLAGFGSRDGGAIGFVTSSQVSYLARPDRRLRFPLPSRPMNVQLIKLPQGADDLFVRACIAARVDGIVIEGIGGGGVTDPVYDALCVAIDAGIAVVVVTRLPRGGVVPDGGGGGVGGGDYALKGSSGNLLARGAIAGGYLSGLKARILLMVALAHGSDRAALADHFSKA